MFAGVCLSVGLVCGLINGVLVSSAGLTPIIATLGTSLAFTGVSVVLTNGSGVRLGYIEPLDDFGHMPVLGIPICFGLFRYRCRGNRRQRFGLLRSACVFTSSAATPRRRGSQASISVPC